MARSARKKGRTRTSARTAKSTRPSPRARPAAARKAGAKPRARKGASAPQSLAFDADPDRRLVAVDFPGAVDDPGGPRTLAQRPDQAFRVLRPSDLAIFDVRCYGTRLESGDEGPRLVPTGAGARIEIGLSYQHLGERAYFRSDPLPGPNPGDEPADPPPIPALAAQPSRLVFDLPAGDAVPYSIAGVLAAMSRLPLRVAPLATPRTIAARPVRDGLIDIATLPGGFQLVRDGAGLLAITAGRVPSGAATAKGVIEQARALRTARTVLATETAVDVSNKAIAPGAGSGRDPQGRPVRAIGRGIGDLVAVPPRVIVRRERPREPREDETSIEAPFRLIISPSEQGGFTHAVEPAAAGADTSRVELWHTRLGVRKVDPDEGTVTIDESRHSQRVIRAIWARDKAGLPDDQNPPMADTPFRMSLNPFDRVRLVRQSADPKLAPPQPVEVDKLHLSSLGAWLDLHGRWPNFQPYIPTGLPILSWDHDAPMGRDENVVVVEPFFCFPFGHKTTLVKVTERKILDASQPQGILIQRKFIRIIQPVKTFDDRRMPFRRVAIRPRRTPSLRDPLLPATPFVLQPGELFWPVVGNDTFKFTLDCLDWNGKVHKLHAPLLMVAANLPNNQPGKTAADIRAAYAADPSSVIPADGQSIAFAAGAVAGDTSFESVSLKFDGIPGPAGSTSATPSSTRPSSSSPRCATSRPRRRRPRSSTRRST
ncbi:MAG: hypothetical protein R2712_03860 [Vicinamibacterales bacterium]